MSINNICRCHNSILSGNCEGARRIRTILQSENRPIFLSKMHCGQAFSRRFISQSRMLKTVDSGSVKAEEIAKFEKMSSSWWDMSRGQMKELHSMNKLRVPFIRDGLLQNVKNYSQTDADVPRPLEGFKILDIGCGGGILCEPLGRLGATVTGIDPGPENISVAQTHLPQNLANAVSYECITIEDFKIKNKNNFDAVVMSEVIEHVENPEKFVGTATEVLKPGGSLFLTTLNRTKESYVGAILAWEYLLKRLPIGTHDWKKFLTPEDIEKIFRSNGLRLTLVHGMCYNPVSNSWRWSTHRAINYAAHAVKNG